MFWYYNVNTDCQCSGTVEHSDGHRLWTNDAVTFSVLSYPDCRHNGVRVYLGCSTGPRLLPRLLYEVRGLTTFISTARAMSVSTVEVRGLTTFISTK